MGVLRSLGRLRIVPRTTLDTAALAHDLRLAVMRFSRRLRQQRVDTSVTLTQLAALSTLKRHGPMSPGELAAHERVQPPSMTRIVVALEGMGLVTRSPHATDGRQVVIDLTATAEELLTAEAQAREAWLSGQLGELTEEEHTVLREAATIMEKLAAR
jgi:DNA-binding MarR family transcriptional regulator